MSQKVETHPSIDGPFRLGEWLVEPRLNRLTRGEHSIQIELKMMDVLVCLAEHPGELVERQQLIDTVWATEFISENILTRAVAELRNVLGDDARNPSFIETIHRKGYRLIAPVEGVVSDEAMTTKVARFPVPERRTGEDERSPYPGLAAFTEEDAEFFFGRETEVAQLWRKITMRRLLAVIGPSGVGKSSFLRAGLVPAAPKGWTMVVCQPGENPLAGLARALLPEFEGDRAAVEGLVGISDTDTAAALVGRWRDRNDQALLIVDQFEELFTQNPPEEQAGFAGFLRKLVDTADVHVMLSMRDDFLYRCHDYDVLAPIYDSLTPIKAPKGHALRQAVLAPASRFGHSFEDESLVDEMLETVEGERGGLPLLAFSMARLWDKRDRKLRMLTRQAYEDIGGVTGALAQHAESTLTTIGDDRLPMVRELFRNLITAEGTRAVRESNELLSVFPEARREEAQQVLHRLVDARLLTSFEEEAVEGNAGHHRVEVVHESLLSSWPRLVRWQTQDADAAQVRDELRQASRSWDEHGRQLDRLWTGAAYREYLVWRERYSGGLSDIEDEFVLAMTSNSKRRKRRRRIAVAVVIGVLLVGLMVVGSFWRQSVAEANRADAANLVSLGQLEIDSNPSVTIGHAIASLELADNVGARRLALEALWRGPTALVANEESSWAAAFTPDGRSLVQGGDRNGHIRLIHSDGTSELLDHNHEATRINITMASETDAYFSFGWFAEPPTQWLVSLWSASERRPLGSAKYEGTVEMVGTNPLNQAVDVRRSRGVYLVRESDRISVDAIGFDGECQRLGTLDFDFDFEEFAGERWIGGARLDPRAGEWVGVAHGDDLYVVEIGDRELSPPRFLGRHEDLWSIGCDPLGRYFATADADGEIRLWSLTNMSPPTVLQAPSKHRLYFTDDGSFLTSRVGARTTDVRVCAWSLEDETPRLLGRFPFNPPGIGERAWDTVGRRFARSGPDQKIRLWSIGAPADAEPVFLLRGEVDRSWNLSFHPNAQWLANADRTGVALWPLARSYPMVIRRHEKRVTDLLFGPKGRWLASISMDDTVRIWPLEGEVPSPGRVLLQDPDEQFMQLARTPDGENLLVGTSWTGVRLVSLSGEESQTVPKVGRTIQVVTIGPSGRLAAGVVGFHSPQSRIVVWDLTSGEVVTTLQPEGQSTSQLQFTGDGHVRAASELGFHSLNLETGESQLLYEGAVLSFSANIDRKRVALIKWTHLEMTDPMRAVILDLETGQTRTLASHGTRVNEVALSKDGTMVVTGDLDGVVRVGPISGDEPHLLLGHENTVTSLDIDPFGRWIASGGDDKTVRLWPMPDLSKPPLHTLPRQELIAKLKTLTNYRVVRDPDSPTGWKLTHDPFPGWETVPTW